MDRFALLIKTVKEIEPYVLKMSESEYQKHKQEIFKDTADTGELSVYQFMTEVFELLEEKRKAVSHE